MAISANQGEGKSTVAANLANVLAESGEQVVLIDADLRRSAVARAFDPTGPWGSPRCSPARSHCAMPSRTPTCPVCRSSRRA
ncbi:P-loop NTPase [Janibacter indicus]|uniref:tyrosine-protein kinase family protein n=1 Tax=Janibacter indicus TaxID=857417 RepID=UPI000934CA2B